jgi:hypothetical protein
MAKAILTMKKKDMKWNLTLKSLSCPTLVICFRYLFHTLPDGKAPLRDNSSPDGKP